MNYQTASIEATSNDVQGQVEEASEMNTEKVLQYIEDHFPEFDDDLGLDDDCDGVWICKECWEVMQAEKSDQSDAAGQIQQDTETLTARIKKKVAGFFRH